MYKIIGYYICEKATIPEWTNIKGDIMITVSSCFTNIHPDLTYCYFVNNRKEERKEYHHKWNLTKEKALELQNDIYSMFEKSLAIDGRFLNLEDAKRFRETYFNSENCMIVSVSTTEEYYEILTEEIRNDSSGSNDFFSNIPDENDFLGYDVLGWDISGFHTFLCNSLHKEFDCLRFNQFCLLENDFEVVQKLAEHIQGKGEPVEWIPCRIGSCE